MSTLTTITRLPPQAPSASKGESVDAVARSQLPPISTALPLTVDTPDRLLILSRKFAGDSLDEADAMDGTRQDGLES